LFKNDLIAIYMKSKEKLQWNCYFSISLIHHSLFCYIILCSFKWFKHTTQSVRENRSFVLAIQHANSKNTILRLWYPETFQVIHKDKRWMYTWPWLGPYCGLIHVCAQAKTSTASRTNVTTVLMVQSYQPTLYFFVFMQIFGNALYGF
jgi:hypothetical protein